MLSRAEYRGRLPYEEYVRRHKLREAANIERIKELGGDIPRLPRQWSEVKCDRNPKSTM